MTLKELGEQYLAESERIREKIRFLRANSKGLTQKELFRLRGRILSLYADAAALKTTGAHLINYYGEQNEQQATL